VGIYTVRRQAVFLDRDGVLNRAFVRNGKPYPPSKIEELEMLPGVSEACHDLRRAGFLLIMVTNQPDVARGRQTRKVVEAINRILSDRLSLDDIKVCYHDNSDNCKCRKPEPGLFLEAAQEWKLDLSGSFVVGDRWKDIEAGRRAGCSTIFVDYGYSEVRPESFDKLAASLTDAVDWILQNSPLLKGEHK
jgi:D-glycero-D-manno-heptose 1,7-bisphosphate phosphatase